MQIRRTLKYIWSQHQICCLTYVSPQAFPNEKNGLALKYGRQAAKVALLGWKFFVFLSIDPSRLETTNAKRQLW